MRINILFSYIVMNTRGRGEPMHHQPITISKGGDHGFQCRRVVLSVVAISGVVGTSQHRTNECEFFFVQNSF